MDSNLTIRPKDSGYQVIVSFKDDNGRWRQRSHQGFGTKKEAKRAGMRIIDELKATPAARDTEFAGITFGEFAALFMRDMEGTLRPGTLDNNALPQNRQHSPMHSAPIFRSLFSQLKLPNYAKTRRNFCRFFDDCLQIKKGRRFSFSSLMFFLTYFINTFTTAINMSIISIT